ncbi:hypothetical protein O9992_23215 [Vibrio lentus]|nr:hypothetical protein [Vibrio lentus]
MDRSDLVKSNLEKMIGLNSTVPTSSLGSKSLLARSQQEHHVANLHQAVNNSTSILSAVMIKQGITLRLSTIPDDLQYRYSPNRRELEQVLVNLIHNATQALATGIPTASIPTASASATRPVTGSNRAAVFRSQRLNPTASPQIGIEWHLERHLQAYGVG